MNGKVVRVQGKKKYVGRERGITLLILNPHG